MGLRATNYVAWQCAMLITSRYALTSMSMISHWMLMNPLQTFYDELEVKIEEVTKANRVDDKLQMELTSILFIIM